MLIGVDASPEAARAAALGWTVATTAHARYKIVHVLREPVDIAALPSAPAGLPALHRMLETGARTAIEAALAGMIPDPVIHSLEIQSGSPAVILADLARDADLLVVGGKHHSALGRWVVGSTVHQLARSITTPLLIAGPVTTPPRRIIAAVDLSAAAGPTLAQAVKYARLFGAHLGVLHVVEPLDYNLDPLLGPLAGPMPVIMDNAERFRVAGDMLREVIWPDVQYEHAVELLRQGPVDATLRAEVRDWGAEWVVVGSHGKGWVDRLLLGSQSHRLLGDLPCTTLMVPVRNHVAPGTVGAAPAAREWHT